MINLNTNAGFNSHFGKAGIGIVALDNQGKLIQLLLSQWTSSNLAAIQEGLVQARQLLWDGLDKE